jgi:eukaryotic-like serine/threonine-protein kinase
MPRLGHLYCFAGAADDATLEQLKSIPSLTQLILPRLGGSGKLGPRGMAALTQLPLQQLSFGECPVADRDFFKLVAQMSQLEQFGASGANINDDSTAEFAHCPRLKILSLSDSAVTDGGLGSLSGLSALRLLYVTKTKVTEPGVKKLAAALPRCKIEWDGGVIEPKEK